MRTGIFICHCGHNIKQTVDVAGLSAYFGQFPTVVVAEDYPFVCSEPGQDMIRESIEKDSLDRVIIASCTPSLHQELFKDLLKKSGLNPFLLRRVGIREHCSWVGDDIERNTEKARRLIMAGLFSASHYVPLEETRVDVTKSALVIGGGVSGLSAALFLSKMGIQVFLVEKAPDLGGHVRQLKDFWPARQDGADVVGEMEAALRARPNVEIFTSAAIHAFEGSFGNYTATLNTPAGERRIVAGGVIVAIGFTSFDPHVKPELAYGKDGRVMTTIDFERDKTSLPLPERPRVAILHCVGSRDEQIGKPYCSRVCCINALRVADAVKERYADSYVESFYMDVRAHPRGGEEFYEDTQEKGVLFTRANSSRDHSEARRASSSGARTRSSASPSSGSSTLPCLSVGMSPPEDNRHISSLLKISLDKDGFFLEAHVKLQAL